MSPLFTIARPDEPESEITFHITNTALFNDRPLLPPLVKAEWLAALRSGKYPQGYMYLQADNRFCCLGVLCDLQKLPFVEEHYIYKNHSLKSALPLGWFEALTGTGDFPYGIKSIRQSDSYEFLALAALNDANYPFTEIATVIDHLY